jgi:peptidoglycan/LPS O-acetylase OafA/YrhL
MGTKPLSGIGLLAASYSYNLGLGMGWKWSTYWGGWARVMWSFPVGILLYRYYKVAEPVTYLHWLGAVLAVTVVAALVTDRTHSLLVLIWPVFVFPVMILIGARIEVRGWAGALSAWLGKVSYAVYITHAGVFRLLTVAYSLVGIDPSHHVRLNTVLWTLVALAAAWGFDSVYDARVRRYLTRSFA